MSEKATPAGQTGGDNFTSTHPELAGLPDRVRVHALAKLLDRISRDVLDALVVLGEDGRSAQSSIPRDVALKVAQKLLGVQAEEPARATEPPARPAVAAPPLPVFASASPCSFRPIRVRRHPSRCARPVR